MPVDYNKVFPETIAQGVVGGPEFMTDITQLRSGVEKRNTPWSDPLHRYNAGLGIREVNDLYEFQDFFYATRGMLKTFRFKDWSDFKTVRDQVKDISPTDQVLGTGDGETYYFRTYKQYGEYNRRITNPREFTCRVAFDLEEISTDAFFVDDQNGTIVFLIPPPAGSKITWGGHFDIPTRFDSDYIPTQLKLFSMGSVPDIPLVEDRFVESIVEENYQKAIQILSKYPKSNFVDLANVYDYTVNTHWKGFWELA